MILSIGTIVLEQYGRTGKVVKVYDDFSACAASCRTMTGDEWLAEQTIPFTDEQLDEVWYEVEIEVGGSVWSPRSRLTVL